MEVHADARLSPLGRLLMCQRVRLEGWTVPDAAEAANVSERTVYEWLARYDAGESMTDRSSRLRTSPGRTPPKVEAVIERLRRLRKTSSTIAALLGMAVSTVCAVLARLGLNRLSRLEPPEPPNRYARRHPGELLHLDVKKLGRFSRPGKRALGQGPGRRSRKAGWEAVHVAVDDSSRLAYVEVLPNETALVTIGFLHRRPHRLRRAGGRAGARLLLRGGRRRLLSARTLRRRRDEWIAAGVAERLRRLVLAQYDRTVGLDLEHGSVDGCITKAPCGGEVAGRSLVDRGKRGLERSMVVDARDVPLGAVAAPANTNDAPLLAVTSDALAGRGPLPERVTAHLERGYDSATTGAEPERRGLAGRIARRGEPAPVPAGRRWVVERTHAWINDHRKLARCTERRRRCVEFYLALAQVLVTVRALIRQAKTRYRW